MIFAGRHNEVLRNLLVQLKDTSPERFRRLLEILEQRFGARLEAVGFDEAQDEYVRADFASGANVRHDLYSAGSGFIQVVQLLAFVMAQSPSIVLLDEPDAHLHSSLQRAIIEILDDIGRDDGYQVVIATHSKEIINFIDPSRLIFVRPGEAGAAPMSDEVTPLEMLRSLGAIDSVDAVALVRNRRCLFVEGTSDVSILGRFASTLRIHALTGDDRVVTIPTGGADRFGHVEQLDVFEQLIGSAIPRLRFATGMAARPNTGRSWSTVRSGRCTCLNETRSRATCFRLKFWHASCTKSRKSADGRSWSANRDGKLLLDVCEELREATTDRVAERYVDDRWRLGSERVTVSTANERAREMVGSSWDDLDGRLIIVSGKKLLSGVRGRVQSQYGVNFGNERLAEGFREAEIPAELRELLEAVAALTAT